MISFGKFQECFPELCRQRVRIAAIDNTQQGLGGFVKVLEQPPVMTVVAAVHDVPALLEACERESPDVAVVDLGLPLPEDGIAVCRELRRRFPALRVMLATAFEAAGVRAEVRKTGAAHGFALKRYSDGLFWKCVLDVAAGRLAFPNYKAGCLAQELSDEAKQRLLDPACHEVLAALAAILQTTPGSGYGAVKELLIAYAGHRRLGNEKQVRAVLEKVRTLLGMHSTEAARWYAQVTAPTLRP